ncbi:MAG: 50S ribosomal protein L15 [Parcubacteria group bacterium]|nr:50S ribosomal protein L15 [Parcubacteria group bacterium]
MQIHELKPAHKNKSKKRVGRGGKRGTYSGRGQKGQKSRAGRRIKPAFNEYLIRIPKLRGIGNKSLHEKAQVVNVGDLDKKLKDGIVNLQALFEAGLINKKMRAKILGGGTVTKAFAVGKDVEISRSAKAKIEAAGGRIES